VIHARNKTEEAADARVIAHHLFPNSLPYTGLMGAQATTRDGRGERGTLSAVLRRCQLHPGESWVVLDTTAGGMWQEDIGRLLGPARATHLPSGQLLQLPSTVKLVYEVETLAHVTPDVLGRTAIVYVGGTTGGSTVQWQDAVACWWSDSFQELPRISRANARSTQAALMRLIPPTLEHLRAWDEGDSGAREHALVSSFHRLLGAVLAPELGVTGSRNPDVESTARLLQLASAFAYVWSFGSCCRGDSRRAAFDAFARPLLSEVFPSLPLPVEGSLFDSRISFEGLCFTSWHDAFEREGAVAHTAVTHRLQRQHMFTPSYFFHTRQSYAVAQVLGIAQAADLHALVTGPSGVGKSAFMNAVCGGPRGRGVRRVALGVHGTCGDVIQALQQLDVSTNDMATWAGSTFAEGSLWSPRVRSLFLDDLSRPLPSATGPSALETVRAILLDRGLPASASCEARSLMDHVRVVAAATDAGRGDHPLPSRLQRLLLTLRLEEPDEEGLLCIFRPMYEKPCRQTRSYSSSHTVCVYICVCVCRPLQRQTIISMLLLPWRFFGGLPRLLLSPTFSSKVQCIANVY